jgi:hypothetical protein
MCAIVWKPRGQSRAARCEIERLFGSDRHEYMRLQVRAVRENVFQFDECSRTRATRRREDWMEVISWEKEPAADLARVCLLGVSRTMENEERVEVRPVVSK